MILAATTAITVSWPMLATIAAIGVAAIKFGDRLWGRVRNGYRNQNQGPSVETRVTRLEDYGSHVRTELSEIKEELRTMNGRLFRILEKRE